MRALAIAAIGLAVLMVAATSATAGDGFRTFPSCGASAGEDHTCIIGNGWGATFVARAGGREKYNLCINPPTGATSCSKNKTDRSGFDFDRLFSEFENVGFYALTGKKGGHTLDVDRMYLGPGD